MGWGVSTIVITVRPSRSGHVPSAVRIRSRTLHENVLSVSNHTIEERSDRVIKRFSDSRRGQHEREWRALTLLAEHAPGLAPRPIRADLDGSPAAITMSRLQGVPLRGGRLSPEQITALASAVTTLRDAIPSRLLARLPAVTWDQSYVREEIRAWNARPLTAPTAPEVARALREGTRWLDRSAFAGSYSPVFCNGDGNLTNYLWDGERVRVIDFEYSGRNDRGMALAEITEHVSAWVDTEFDIAYFLMHFDHTPAEADHLLECRRLLALDWLCLLAQQEPGKQNPVGSVERQADRLLALLG